MGGQPQGLPNTHQAKKKGVEKGSSLSYMDVRVRQP
jgi:hypothetical protein